MLQKYDVIYTPPTYLNLSWYLCTTWKQTNRQKPQIQRTHPTVDESVFDYDLRYLYSDTNKKKCCDLGMGKIIPKSDQNYKLLSLK